MVELHLEDSTTTEQRAFLQIINGENIGRIIPLSMKMVRIGTARTGSVMIAHRDAGYYLSYLSGSEPALNGMPIGDETVLLTQGSTIKIGETELQFFVSRPLRRVSRSKMGSTHDHR